jgi:hypothetical protein
MCETDKCVFRKIVGGKIFVLLVYVDDILALVDRKEVEIMRARLVERFGTVQFEVARKLSYLGMQIEIREKGVVVDMSYYAKKILEDVEASAAESPGTKAMFIVDEKAKLLEEEGRKLARPDILTAVSFLCTKVQSATEEDMKKLLRVLGYLKSTVGKVLYLRAAGTVQVRAYVDAAYALHNDSRSHTGVIIFVGQTIAFVSSKKQKCMSKSPTEAELIGLSDYLGLVELFKEFLVGRDIEVPIVYQDCKAVISLVTMVVVLRGRNIYGQG